MFKLLNSEVRPLTPEFTERFYSMTASPTERPLNPKRVKYLRDIADAGLLLPFQWAEARCQGATLRVNGQHSSTMLHEMNGSFPNGLTVHHDVFEVDEPGDLALLFRQFDTRTSGRTTGDVSHAYQGLEPALAGVTPDTAKLAIDGIAWHRREIDGLPVEPGDGRYELFTREDYHPFILWLGGVLSIKTPELKRAAVIAAMFGTFEKNADAAKAFWQNVARGGVEYNDSAPATVLDGWLKEQTAAEKTAKPKPGGFYQGCVYAWNASREEKPLSRILSDTRKGLAELRE